MLQTGACKTTARSVGVTFLPHVFDPMFVITASHSGCLAVYNVPTVVLILRRPKQRDILSVTTSCVATFPPCLKIGQNLCYSQWVGHHGVEVVWADVGRVKNHSWISEMTLAASCCRTVKTCAKCKEHVEGNGEGIC